MVVSRPALWLVMAAAGLLVYLLVPHSVSELAADAFSDVFASARATALPLRAPAKIPVLVVAFDESTHAAGVAWPPAPSVLAKAIAALDAKQPAAIGLDTRVNVGLPGDPGGLEALAKAIKTSGHVILREQSFGNSTLGWESSLAAVAAGRGKARLTSSTGPEARGIALDADSYLLELARRHRFAPDARVDHGRLTFAGAASSNPSTGLADGTSLLFRVPPASDLPQVSFSAVLAGKVTAEQVQGRIVLIGATAPDIAQPIALPGGLVWPEVLVEAAAADAMLSERALDASGAGARIAALLALFLTMALVGSLGRWSYAVVAVALAVSAQFAFAAAAYVWWSWRPDPAGSGLALAVAGFVLVAGRAWEWMVTSGRMTSLVGHSASVVAEKNFARARSLIRGSRYADAIPLLQDVMRIDGSRRNQALVEMLGCYLARNELELIEDTYKQIAIEQLSQEDAYALGLKLTEQGYFEEARALFALIYNRDVNFSDVKHQLELVVQAQANRKDVMERLIIKELRAHYRNLEMVRRGGMAIIYRGYWAEQDKVVAVKILTPHLNDDPNVVKRFFLEADTMKEFDHPNIVKVYNIHRDGQLRYYSMESVHPADTLYDLIEREKKLPVRRAIHILKQMCLALQYAHERHVVHRDIKPHNVLIAQGDIVKLIDFGIARFEALSTMTSTGVVMGTPRYMSPEQLKGERVDERTDLYACGVSFFEMLTGITGSENPMLEKVKGRTSIYQLILRQNLPSPLVRMVLKCLEGARERRYSSARELYVDLEEYERLPQAALEM